MEVAAAFPTNPDAALRRLDEPAVLATHGKPLRKGRRGPGASVA